MSKKEDHLLVSEKNGHRLTFNEKSHRYRLDDKWIGGVTTLNKNGYPESMFLSGWKVGQGAKYAIERAMDFYKEYDKKPTKAIIEDIVKTSKMAWTKATKKAADVGSIVHDYAYAYERKLPFDMSIIKKHVDKETIEICINRFLKWKKTNSDKIVASEEIVASPSWWFAGKFDRLVRRKNLLILDDYKTSSGIWPEQFVQLALYRVAIYEWLGLNVQGLEIVRFGKDGSFETQIVTMPDDIQAYTDQGFRNVQTAQFRKKYEDGK